MTCIWNTSFMYSESDLWFLQARWNIYGIYELCIYESFEMEKLLFCDLGTMKKILSKIPILWFGNYGKCYLKFTFCDFGNYGKIIFKIPIFLFENYAKYYLKIWEYFIKKNGFQKYLRKFSKVLG
jgi:hypothetical protein